MAEVRGPAAPSRRKRGGHRHPGPAHCIVEGVLVSQSVKEARLEIVVDPCALLFVMLTSPLFLQIKVVK